MDEDWSPANQFRNFPRQKKVLCMWSKMQFLLCRVEVDNDLCCIFKRKNCCHWIVLKISLFSVSFYTCKQSQYLICSGWKTYLTVNLPTQTLQLYAIQTIETITYGWHFVSITPGTQTTSSYFILLCVLCGEGILAQMIRR